ncbi:MAG: LuxR family transcriptional regulator [Sphingopyxis sp.]|nr:MAG: LuxR family transcriptional regulator [Sphingopyxis sp.]
MPSHFRQLDIAARFALADAFIVNARAVQTAAELRCLMDAFTNEIGFRYFALIHHDDLREPKTGVIHLQNYPDVWADYFIEHRLYLDDPVVHACLRTNCGFSWNELPKLVSLTRRHQGILRSAAKEGLSQGLTIPACVPGERTGSCSLAGPRCGQKVDRFLGLTQIVGAFAFQAARRLLSKDALKTSQRPRLAPRQRECVILVGQGKSNWEIAKILGLSRSTINHYLNDARERYGVVTRTQLVVSAVLDGEVSLSELAPWQYDHMIG